MASALCAAHEAGVIHRDINRKTSCSDGTAMQRWLDFGLAKLTEREPTPAGTQAPTERSSIQTPGSNGHRKLYVA